MRTLVGMLALCLATPVSAQEVKRPNVLVILSDDQSAAVAGCYGNKDVRTPHFDKLAKKGTRLERYYVTTPQCVPSRASLMTGRSPIDIQMTRFSAPLARQYRVYPEILRGHGYFAGVAGRTYHLDGAAVNPVSSSVLQKHDLKTFPGRLDYVKTAGQRAEMIAQFKEFLDLVPRGKPFVLQLCFSDPHRVLDKTGVHDPATITLPRHFPDTPAVRDDFARYLDEVNRFDSDVGTILEELERRGLLADTLVIVSADNGGALFRGKGTLYDLGVRVPLVAYWQKRIPAGQSSAAIFSGEDLAPTILEAAGVPVPKEMTGRSFLGDLLATPGRQAACEYVFCQRGAHGSGLPTNSAAFDLSRCAISQHFKLIYNALPHLPYHPVDFAGDKMWLELKQMHQDGKLAPLMKRLYFDAPRPMFELYDLRNDPDELNNVYDAPKYADVQRAHLAALQEWMILQRDFVPLPIPPDAKKKKNKKA